MRALESDKPKEKHPIQSLIFFILQRTKLLLLIALIERIKFYSICNLLQHSLSMINVQILALNSAVSAPLLPMLIAKQVTKVVLINKRFIGGNLHFLCTNKYTQEGIRKIITLFHAENLFVFKHIRTMNLNSFVCLGKGKLHDRVVIHL